MRRVVDDEVDAGQVLERADVAALAADDPALHVVGAEARHRDRRLGGVTGGDALERVRDEVPCAPLRLGARLLLDHAHTPAEIVAHELLAALRAGAPSPPPATCRRCARARPARRASPAFSSSWSCRQMRLAVGDALVAPGDLDELLLDLLLPREDALLDLEHLLAPVAELGVDLCPELHRLLARLDLGLTPDRLGLALGVLDQLPADPARLPDTRRPEDGHGEQGDHGSYRDPDGNSDPDQHGAAPRSVGRDPPGTAGSDSRSRVLGAPAARSRQPRLPRCRPLSSSARSGSGVCSQGNREFEKHRMQAKCRVKRGWIVAPSPVRRKRAGRVLHRSGVESPGRRASAPSSEPPRRRWTSRRARSRSGSSPASAPSTTSPARPCRSRSNRIAASP